MRIFGLCDIIGPVMVGPSSSHTAGALVIASMARRLCSSAPASVTFVLYGSFAHTGSGHGTDKALVAGMLGLAAEDLDIRRSFDIARERKLDVRFVFDTETVPDHPNTVDISVIQQDGGRLEVRGVSVGGGAAVIRRIDGIDVDITGENTSIVVRQDDVRGVLAHIAECLAARGVNIATTKLFRTKKGHLAYTVMEVDGALPDGVTADLLALPAIHDVRVIPSMRIGGGPDPVLQDGDVDEGELERRFARFDFGSGAELLQRCDAERMTIAQVFRSRELAFADLNGVPFDVDAYLDRVLDVMREAAVGPLEHVQRSMGGLIGGEAWAVARAVADARQGNGVSLIDPLTAAVSSYALAVLETNASMGRIVAAPTAGSAGVLPAVLLGLADERGFTRDQLKEGLLTAAAVGCIIARNASVSGAEGGCQAEIGSAAGMAAAAAVAMAGGAPWRALNAASNALTSMMGLVCDPVGGLVELPCQKRNATAAATALVCAQIALSRVDNMISFDETVAALDAVGRSLPFELRESALGGIAATPSACAWCERGCR